MSRFEWVLGYFAESVRCVICGRPVRYGAFLRSDSGVSGTDRLVLCGSCDSPARRAGLEEIVRRKKNRVHRNA